MRETITLRIPKELKKDLQTMAIEKGYTLNSLILKILWEYLETKKD